MMYRNLSGEILENWVKCKEEMAEKKGIDIRLGGKEELRDYSKGLIIVGLILAVVLVYSKFYM